MKTQSRVWIISIPTWKYQRKKFFKVLLPIITWFSPNSHKSSFQLNSFLRNIDLNQLNKKHILSAFLEDIQSRLSRVDWESEHLDNAVFYLLNAIKEATEKDIPLKPVLTKKKFWVDNSVKRSINKRNELYRIYKIDPSNPITKEAFERQRRETKALLRSKKSGFIQANFEKTFGDMKMFHRQLDDIIGKVNEEIQPSLSETKTIDDFNSYFVNVGLNNQRTIEHVEFNMNQSSRQMQSAFLRPTSADEIQSIIGKLKNQTSTGPFGISNKLLKVYEWVVSPILATMINRCMSIGYFPELLKVAKVVPIYKEGDRDTISNYRPISPLSIFKNFRATNLFENLFLHRKVRPAEWYSVRFQKEKKNSRCIGLCHRADQNSNECKAPFLLCFFRCEESFRNVRSWYSSKQTRIFRLQGVRFVHFLSVNEISIYVSKRW